ncbi:hypothetical protein Ddye_010335 [Dipteronia dyeriana]|uniref:Transmembrane protein n=1 Tax=Dipteronia dyeriana TaxID=168575 RepID=A0AAE0CNQ5_9ROSI|nr:hypothetical protein Ddye_010335 [Dipteronia dyeriana]
MEPKSLDCIQIFRRAFSMSLGSIYKPVFLGINLRSLMTFVTNEGLDFILLVQSISQTSMASIWRSLMTSVTNEDLDFIVKFYLVSFFLFLFHVYSFQSQDVFQESKPIRFLRD